MKLRTAHLVFLFVISFVGFTGCRKPQGITEAQYKQVVAVAREEFINEGFGPGGRIPQLVIKVPRWIKKRGKCVINFRHDLFCRIPRMALKRDRIRRTTHRVIRKACRKADVSFKGFDEAHAKYSRLELTYSAEREELNGLLKVFSPAARKAFKEKEEHDKDWNADSAALANLDEAKVERASWLAFDMGLPLGGEYRILVEIDRNGDSTIDGEPRSIIEYVAPIMVEDPYRLVYIMPDPKLPAGELFDILDSVRTTGAQRVAFSDRLSEGLYVIKAHSIPSREHVEPGGGFKGVLVQITNEDQVFLNHEEINYREDNLDSILKVSFERAELKFFLIIAEENATCKKVIKLGLKAQRICKSVYPLSDSWILPSAQIGIRM